MQRKFAIFTVNFNINWVSRFNGTKRREVELKIYQSKEVGFDGNGEFAVRIRPDFLKLKLEISFDGEQEIKGSLN